MSHDELTALVVIGLPAIVVFITGLDLLISWWVDR